MKQERLILWHNSNRWLKMNAADERKQKKLSQPKLKLRQNIW